MEIVEVVHTLRMKSLILRGNDRIKNQVMFEIQVVKLVSSRIELGGGRYLNYS